MKEAPVESECFIHDTAGVMRVEYDEGRGFLSSVINIVIVLILPRLSWTELIVCPSWQNCFGTDHEEKKIKLCCFSGHKVHRLLGLAAAEELQEALLHC